MRLTFKTILSTIAICVISGAIGQDCDNFSFQCAKENGDSPAPRECTLFFLSCNEVTGDITVEPVPTEEVKNTLQRPYKLNYVSTICINLYTIIILGLVCQDDELRSISFVRCEFPSSTTTTSPFSPTTTTTTPVGPTGGFDDAIDVLEYNADW